MKKQQEMVREFMLLAAQGSPDRPSILPPNVAKLRMDLIWEEAKELFIALGMPEDFGEGVKFMGDPNLFEVADAIGDLLVVVLGTAVACGIDIEPIFNEIHRSNMTKFIDGHRREDGKWVKGPSYSPAELKPILFDQMHGIS